MKMVLDETGHGMKMVLDESGFGTKVVLDEFFGMKSNSFIPNWMNLYLTGALTAYTSSRNANRNSLGKRSRFTSHRELCTARLNR